MKWKLLREASYAGSCICALAATQCACIIAEHPECWIESLILTVAFGTLAIGLYRLAERIDRALHMTRLQILQAAQTKRAGHSGNCGRPEPRKAAN